MFTGLFMDKMVSFLKLYFPVFMLGALFGKLIELSGFSRAMVAATIGLVGRGRAMLSIVLVCALLTSMNTASEYGFGAVIAALPGFKVVADALHSIPNPLMNEAVTVTALAGITGSASGGLSIALAAMANIFLAHAHAAGIPLEVFHRIAAMASGGMDTLPHNGAVITLLAVTGLTHRQSYRDIFAITVIKTLAVFVVIVVFAFTGLV